MMLKLRSILFALAALLGTATLLGQQITSFSPTAGSPGDPNYVFIYGSGFDPGFGGTLVVTFNGTRDFTAQATSDSQIQAQVPNGATTGPIYVQVNGGTLVHS